MRFVPKHPNWFWSNSPVGHLELNIFLIISSIYESIMINKTIIAFEECEFFSKVEKTLNELVSKIKKEKEKKTFIQMINAFIPSFFYHFFAIGTTICSKTSILRLRMHLKKNKLIFKFSRGTGWTLVYISLTRNFKNKSSIVAVFFFFQKKKTKIEKEKNLNF